MRRAVIRRRRIIDARAAYIPFEPAVIGARNRPSVIGRPGAGPAPFIFVGTGHGIVGIAIAIVIADARAWRRWAVPPVILRLVDRHAGDRADARADQRAGSPIAASGDAVARNTANDCADRCAAHAIVAAIIGIVAIAALIAVPVDVRAVIIDAPIAIGHDRIVIIARPAIAGRGSRQPIGRVIGDIVIRADPVARQDEAAHRALIAIPPTRRAPSRIPAPLLARTPAMHVAVNDAWAHDMRSATTIRPCGRYRSGRCQSRADQGEFQHPHGQVSR